jgi:hypothetical protein
MVRKNFKPSWLALGIAALFLISAFTVADHAAAALTTFETADFSGSGICAFCHSSLRDAKNNDVSMDAHWRSTMMANAAKDPLWQAKISTEVELAPHLAQEIQEKCSRCHMGMARYQQMADGDTKYDIYVFDTDPEIGFLNQNHYLHEAAMDGVSCTLCHQITSEGLGTDQSYTGQYVIDTTTESPERLIFGPYSNPLFGPMRRNSGFRPTDHNDDGGQLADSAHCGSCHTLYTPALNAEGTIIGKFPEQTTYLEWEHSGSNRTCQDCHLPEAAGEVAISNIPRNLAGRSPFGQHHYVGGNIFMVNLLKANRTALGVTADPKHLQATIGRTEAQLQENTATLAVVDASLLDDLLTVTVDVTNLAGHKFPSGLPSRRAWLHVTVADANGDTVFESGKPLAEGKIQGNDADSPTPDAYEPHYEKITSSEQVQIYEPIMLNSDEAVTYTLLRAYEYAKDNRLLPDGFVKVDADADFAVYGDAVDDTNFIGGSDRIDYEISNVSNGASVTVELLFQVLSYPFVADLENTQTGLVQDFMGMYNPADNTPVVVDTIQFTVP